MIVPDPVVTVTDDGHPIVRDDLILGGTKARVAAALVEASGADEVVYAGPAQGYAQVALGVATATTGIPTTVFIPASKDPHPLSLAAATLGSRVVAVRAGRLSVLQARARAYCEATGALLAPLGLRLPGLDHLLAAVAEAIDPPEVAVVAAGSGSLASALATAWPSTSVHAVIVGSDPRQRHPAVTYHHSPVAFTAPSPGPPPPVPTLATYDAKAWPVALSHAGALWWNVAGSPPTTATVSACIRRSHLALTPNEC